MRYGAGVRLRRPQRAMFRGLRMANLRPVLEWMQKRGLFFALLILVVFFWATSDRFMTASNIAVILQQVAVNGLVAIPGAMLILSGYVDLSIGSIAVLSAVVFGEAMAAKMGLGPSIGSASLPALPGACSTGISSPISASRRSSSRSAVSLARAGCRN